MHVGVEVIQHAETRHNIGHANCSLSCVMLHQKHEKRPPFFGEFMVLLSRIGEHVSAPYAAHGAGPGLSKWCYVGI